MSASLNASYPSGLTEAALTLSKRYRDPYSWSGASNRFSASNSSIAHADTTPWAASGTLSFAYTPSAFLVQAQGCELEPTGSLSVDVLSAPGGSVQTSVSITFDPATACDGCGEVTQDGALLGTVCSALWSGALTGGS